MSKHWNSGIGLLLYFVKVVKVSGRSREGSVTREGFPLLSRLNSG